MGLSRRGQVWHMYKTVKVGQTRIEIRESSGKTSKREAEEIFARRIKVFLVVLLVKLKKS